LSFSLMSMVTRHLKLRFRALPENRAAIKAALMGPLPEPPPTMDETSSIYLAAFIFNKRGWDQSFRCRRYNKFFKFPTAVIPGFSFTTPFKRNQIFINVPFNIAVTFNQTSPITKWGSGWWLPLHWNKRIPYFL